MTFLNSNAKNPTEIPVVINIPVRTGLEVSLKDNGSANKIIENITPAKLPIAILFQFLYLCLFKSIAVPNSITDLRKEVNPM